MLHRMTSPQRQNRRIFSSLRLLHRNHLWFSSDTRTSDKLAYYGHLFFASFRLLWGKKSIFYLGHYFCYDNYATPLNLQIYPNEISRKLLKNLTNAPATVLDVGGNIGQFATTLAYFCDIERIDIFEPNPLLQELLSSNVQHLGSRANIYAAGISNSSHNTDTLYFEPGRSAIGSFFRENAGDAELVKNIPVAIVNDIATYTGHSNYDLIKVDVEGMEIEVIRALSTVRTKYLFIEVSGAIRKRMYTDSELFEAINISLGTYTVLYSSGMTRTSLTYEMLLGFDEV